MAPSATLALFSPPSTLNFDAKFSFNFKVNHQTTTNLLMLRSSSPFLRQSMMRSGCGGAGGNTGLSRNGAVPEKADVLGASSRQGCFGGGTELKHLHSHHGKTGGLGGFIGSFESHSLLLPRRHHPHCLRLHGRIYCNYDDNISRQPYPSTSSPSSSPGIQLYGEIERLITDAVRQSQGALGGWDEIEGAWVLRPRRSRPNSVVHFVGGIFVGAAPQLTYRLFLERLADKGILVIATPYASGFDHFFIADEVQFKFDRCFRYLKETVQDLPTFGVGHSLGSVIHLLIGSRYAVQRSGNVLMSFNNKEASTAIPLFSPVLVPVAQSIGPFLSQIAASPTVRLGAEMTLKQLENLSPPLMKQVLPLVEQLPPLYMDLVKGREDFSPRPEETRRLIKSYYGVSRNLLVKFKDDAIDETSTLAQVLSSESAISSMLDMSIRSLPGDHGLPLQQALPDVPPSMADAVNRGSEFLANLTVGTPWETVAKEVGNTLGTDSRILRAEISKDINLLVDVISSWIASNSMPKALRS